LNSARSLPAYAAFKAGNAEIQPRSVFTKVIGI
jgi:hypothetical protein